MLRETQIIVLIALTIGSAAALGAYYAWPALPWFTYPVVANLVAWPVYTRMLYTAAHRKTEERANI